MTQLMQAVTRNDAQSVRQLIESGTDVNQVDANGDVPVIMAAYKGHTEVLQMLLAAGADLTAVDPGMKATALHAAAYAGRTEAARMLVQAGINIDQQGPYNGYTALHDAIWQNNIDTAAVLIEAGADLNIRGNSGQTPLEFAKANNRREIVARIEQKLAGG